MKDIERKAKIYCPVCGNDQFMSLDCTFEDLLAAPEEVRLQCSDCHNVFTKEALIEENQETINAAIDEVKEAAVKEFEKELKNALKKLR